MPQTPLSRTPPENMPPGLRKAWERSQELRGDATLMEAFGNEPRLFEWYVERFYGEVFRAGRVPLRSKELARYRLSTTHGCRFCNQGNRLDALDAGVTEAQLRAIENNQLDEFDDADSALLALADQMVLTNATGKLSPELHARLSEFFDDGQLMELGLTLAVLVGMARFMFVFDLVEREDSCPFS